MSGPILITVGNLLRKTLNRLPLRRRRSTRHEAMVSYVSPLARAVLTHGPGETVEMTGGEAVILDVR
jgi:transcription elongation GreA/GreB family factor